MEKEDSNVLNSLFICMSPLIPETTPKTDQLVQLAVKTAKEGKIDPVENLADDRLYIFTGSRDKVVFSDVVLRTRQFYELLGVQQKNIAYHDDVPAGHSIITDNPEDLPLESNQPPYINQGGFIQPYDILRHIYPDLKPPAKKLSGSIVRFDQREFFNNEECASMSRFGYAHIPHSVEKEGAPARTLPFTAANRGITTYSISTGRRMFRIVRPMATGILPPRATIILQTRMISSFFILRPKVQMMA